MTAETMSLLERKYASPKGDRVVDGNSLFGRIAE